MKGLSVGQEATVSRVFTVEDLTVYQSLSGDEGLSFGPLPTSGAVPGPLLAGMFSDLLGTKLPGRGTNWLKQQLRFPTSALVGEEITASVQITRLRPDKNLVNLSTRCTNQTGEIVCEGEALVLVRDLQDEAPEITKEEP
jgi:hypothetical protein